MPPKAYRVKTNPFHKMIIPEIGVPEEKVNLSSLNSAMVRQGKKKKKVN
jgi:hypothetical protein